MTDSDARSAKLQAGTISGAYGIKGWVRVHALTDPPENFLDFPRWFIKANGRGITGTPGYDRVHFEDGRRHGRGLIAKIKGVEDRTAAELLRGTQVWVDAGDLAPLGEGEFYWYQLVGLEVWCRAVSQHDDAGGAASGRDIGAGDSGRGGSAGHSAAVLLGVVDHLLETGANDVLVIAPCEGSVDQRERLLPYLPGRVVAKVDLQTGRIDVNWHPDD